jgi:hypothetical protein
LSGGPAGAVQSFAAATDPPEARGVAMILIWSGWGPLVIPVVAACFVATQFGINGLTGDPQFYQAHTWPKVAAFLLAAAGSWLFGRYLNRTTDHLVLNPVTGRKQIVRVRRGHSLFFVPIQYCWIPLVVLGGVLALR